MNWVLHATNFIIKDKPEVDGVSGRGLGLVHKPLTILLAYVRGGGSEDPTRAMQELVLRSSLEFNQRNRGGRQRYSSWHLLGGVKGTQIPERMKGESPWDLTWQKEIGGVGPKSSTG